MEFNDDLKVKFCNARMTSGAGWSRMEPPGASAKLYAKVRRELIRYVLCQRGSGSVEKRRNSVSTKNMVSTGRSLGDYIIRITCPRPQCYVFYICHAGGSLGLPLTFKFTIGGPMFRLKRHYKLASQMLKVLDRLSQA